MTATPIVLPEPMESAVRFVEDTPPGRIVDETIARLRDGASARELLIAAALAVSRSTILPATHHGGPVHPVAAVHALDDLAHRMGGDWALMPAVQQVALCNGFIHAPEMGPALMASIEVKGNGADHAAAFSEALGTAQPAAAEYHLMALLESVTPGEILDLVVEHATRRHAIDDHFFIYAIATFRALDLVGWEWAPVLLRPAVRYLAVHPQSVIDGDEGSPGFVEAIRRYWDFPRLGRLIEEHGLDAGNPRVETGTDEDAAVAALGREIGNCRDFSRIAGILATALGGGLSLEGAGEALAIGASRLMLRSNYGNPLDTHMHNGVALRRYLIGIEGVSPRHKLLALLSWGEGPENRGTESKLVWPVGAEPERLAALPARDQSALLDAISESVLGSEVIDVHSVSAAGRGALVVGPEVRETMALAQQYAEAGYDGAALLARLAEIVMRDGYSEMHAATHLYDVAEAWDTTRPAERWVHLAAAAKNAALSYGIDEDVYRRAKARLAI